MTSTPVVSRRARTPGRDKNRTYKCPDDVYDAALAAAHARGLSLGAYIVTKLEELANDHAASGQAPGAE